MDGPLRPYGEGARHETEGLQQYPEDALHIAVAAVNGMDVLVTWNFAHLSNPFTRVRVRQLVQDEGFACREICSPEELLESES